MKTPVLRGILFDLDDTLIDWSGFHGDWRIIERKHLQQVYDFLRTSKRPLSCELDVFANAYGSMVMEAWAAARSSLRAPHLGHILQQTLERFGFTPDDEITLEDCLDAYEWGPVPGVVVFPDVPKVLQEFVNRGVRIGIVTNAAQPMRLRDSELHAYGLLEYFSIPAARIAAADVGYLKPDPSIFQHALEALDTTAEETVFVGDNPVADIAGAQAAGMRAVLRVKKPAQALISGLIQPDAAINSLEELPTILDDWYPGW